MKTITITEAEKRLLVDILWEYHSLCRVGCYYDYKTDMCYKCKLGERVIQLIRKIEGRADGEFDE